MFRQYRPAAVWAIPVGALLGAVVGLIAVVGGNPDNRGWGSLFQAVFTAAAVGAVNALAALGAGALTVWLADRSRSVPRVWVYGGSLGAAAGPLVLWLLFGATGGWAWMAAMAMPGIIAAIVA